MISKFINFFSLAFFLLIITSCNAQIKSLSGNKIGHTELDAFLKHQMDSLTIPGLSIAVIYDGEIVYNRALGVTNTNTLEEVGPQTLFEAASMSKSVFAYFVMRMVEKGLLDLDTPLYKYLPYADIEHDERYKLITARMALSHTTGFPNWRFHNEDGKLDIKFTPGTQFSYSGEGYEYLARVIAHLTGNNLTTLEELFQKEVAQLLDMQNSYFTRNEYLEKNKAYGHTGEEVEENRWYTDLSKFGAAHSLHSNATDFSRFMIGIMKEKGLQEKSYEELLKKQQSIPDGDGLKEEYGFESWGLGIMRAPTPYGMKYAHGGINEHFQAYYMMIKEKGFGFVFFANNDRGLEMLNSLEHYLTTGEEIKQGL